MNRKQKIIVSVVAILIVTLALIGITYAYFLTQISGNTNTKSIEVSTADLKLVYGDGNGSITATNITPGKEISSKEFNVTNSGNTESSYVAILEDVTYKNTRDNSSINGFTRPDDLKYTLTCKQYNDSDVETGDCDGVSNDTFPNATDMSVMVSNKIPSGYVHKYVLTLNYIEAGVDQSADMGKGLSAKVNIRDIKMSNPYATIGGTAENPVEEPNDTLAYNIINNAKLNKNGTSLVNAPLTKPAEEISTSWGTGKYDSNKLENFKMPYGFDPWLYADTEADASSGVSASGKNCSDLIGKYIYDQSITIPEVFQIVDCDSNNEPIIRIEIIDFEKEISVTQDDYGTSYYFRGKVENNYLNFAEMCWRIVRIEGDGSVEIILADKDAKCSSATKDKTGSSFIGEGNYGYTYDYVINSSGQISSNKIYVADYKTGVTNPADSMKTNLDIFLGTLSQANKDKLKDKVWCLGDITNAYDSSTGTLLTEPIKDLMYNNTSFDYKTGKRLYGKVETPNATLKCEGETFTSKIGTLTADEIVFAGAKVGETNTSYYLRDNASSKYWWALSLFGFFDSYVGVAGVSNNGYLNGNVLDNDRYGFRSAVSLVSGTKISDGDGTLTKPYVVKMD